MFLTLITFLPLFGALFLVFMPKESVAAIKQTALAIAGTDFLLSIFLWTNFDNTSHKMQFELNVPWIEAWGINFHVGLDGISLLLYVMTTFLTMICIIASWDVKKHVREYMIAMLTLSTGMLGVFVALDLFMFYVFCFHIPSKIMNKHFRIKVHFSESVLFNVAPSQKYTF